MLLGRLCFTYGLFLDTCCGNMLAVGFWDLVFSCWGCLYLLVIYGCLVALVGLASCLIR